MSRIEISIGEGAVAAAPACIVAAGLGSCVALALHDPAVGVGGMAHIMLPRWDKRVAPSSLSYRWADLALDGLIADMQAIGAELPRIVAKIAGGARMFEFTTGHRASIGEENVASIRALLQQRGIPLVAADVSGQRGRTVEFDVGSGAFTIKFYGGEAARTV